MNKKIISLALSLTMMFGLALSTVVRAEEKTVDNLVSELIYYYKEGDAKTDVARTLDKLKNLSMADYNQWKQIIDYWDYIEKEMPESIGVAPDGLPTDKSHAFVVLGYQLNPDGSMQDELKGRCDVAFESAKKYPNAYIVLSGGGTAKDNPAATEADAMKEYLETKGLDPNRIIVENKSKTTVQNSEFTFNILYTMNSIKSISMITSQYHLKRGTLLYYAKSLMMARKLGKEPIKLMGNAGWLRTDKTSEDLNHKARSLALIAGVPLPGNNGVPVPAKSQLVALTIEGPVEYKKGDTLTARVIASYDIDNYQKDVTSLVTLTGYSLSRPGNQIITTSYTENAITKTATLAIKVHDNIVQVAKRRKMAAKTGDYSPVGLLALLNLFAGVLLVRYRKYQKVA